MNNYEQTEDERGARHIAKMMSSLEFLDAPALMISMLPDTNAMVTCHTDLDTVNDVAEFVAVGLNYLVCTGSDKKEIVRLFTQAFREFTDTTLGNRVQKP